MTAKPKILFISESVSLAHFGRPFELSNNLPKNQYDIHFASAPVYQKFLKSSSHSLHTVHSITPEQFKTALAKGNPIYDFKTLKNYTEEDLRLIDKVKPDIIIGDFRLSLAVSARIAKIPYATITNAYWSPYAPKIYPTPELVFSKYLGLPLTSLLFRLAAPLAFKIHALAMARLKKHYGLPKTPLDLRQVYTEADYTLYADLPSLFPLNNPPESHLFIGPVLWSPPVKKPDWWDSLPDSRPIIYVSMGSTGSVRSLEKVLQALADENVTVMAALAGTAVNIPKVSNFFTADYLDGNAAASRADLVICNGGSLTCQQAFAHGKPVLGIASNMDQFLNMLPITFINVGKLLRSDNLDKSLIKKSYRDLANNLATQENINNIQREIESFNGFQLFASWLLEFFKKDF